jgi:murein DD-endopeptidase MepM/ murein hydrolase activator NlpD
MALKPLLYNNDHAGSISYLVYIGGMEIPSRGFDVSYGVWEIPQASVRLVPDPILHRLGAEDRVPVQCFYLDQWQYSPPQYFLTQTFFFLMSTFDDFAVGTSGAGIGVAGASVQTPGFGALYPYSLFAQGVANSDDVDDDRLIERPIDYAYNIVRSLIKLTHPNRSVPAANFFSPWAMKTNFHRRWVATPYFDADPRDPHAPGLFPVLKAVQDSTAIAAIARQAAQSANGSLWSMLQEILRTVMCELAMLPTPAAVKSDYASLLPKGKPDAPSRGTEPVFLTQYFVKPQSYYSLPPVCNVFFPSQIQNGGYQENIAAQPTRAYYNEATITNILSNNAGNTGSGAQAAAALMQDAMTTGYPEEVDIAIRDARDAALQNGKNMLVYPEEYFKGPVILRKQLPRWFAFLIDSARGTLAQSGTSTQSDPTGGAEGLNNVSQYSETEGGPVYFGSVRNPGDAFVHQLGNPPGLALTGSFNRTADASEQSIILRKSLEIVVNGQPVSPGRCVPPQVFPLRPTSAWAEFGGAGPVRKFWGVRRGGIHGGHDISCPLHTEVVATTDGQIADIYTTPSDTPRARGRYLGPGFHVSSETGNCVIVKDDEGGLHRYLHLYELAVDNRTGLPFVKGARVTKGLHVAYSGNTGRSDGPHLHYDISDSTHKFRMPYPRRLAMLARSPGATAAPPAPAPANTPAQEGGSGTPPQSDQENADLNPNSDRANGGTGNTGTDVASGDTTRNLFKLYAKCDYYTERYAQRNGSVFMPFNPYPIPGFSCAVFDRREVALDTIGYLTNIQHSISATGWGTTGSYTQGRTFQEMFALIQRDAALDNARMARDGIEISDTVGQRYAAAEARILELISASRDKPTVNTREGQIVKYDEHRHPELEWISPWSTQLPAGSTATPGQEAGTVDNRLGGYAAPAGDVRMSPAEPIEEIRQLQDVEIANAFYLAMFWHAEDQMSGADLNAEDVIGADRERDRSNQPSHLTVEQLRAAGESPDRAVVAQAINGTGSATDASRRQARAENGRAARVRLNISAVFRQEDILRMVTPEDAVLDIESTGTSSMSRTQALRLIRKAATDPGNMTDEDIRRLVESGAGDSSAEGVTFEILQWCLPRRVYRPVGDSPGGEPVDGASWAYVPYPQDQHKLLEFLRSQERRWRTQSVTTNVRGDVLLEPTPSAAGLWESYNAAMRYNARPVCTLDEYLLFLGEDAVEDLVEIHPQPSNLGRNDYIHPAKYYEIIRNYSQGPPRARARTLLTGQATGQDETLPGDSVGPSQTPASTATATATPPLAASGPGSAGDGDTWRGLFPNSEQQTARLMRAAGSEIAVAYGRDGTRRHIGSLYVELRVATVLTSYLQDNAARLQGFTPPISKDEAARVARVVAEVLLSENSTTHEPAIDRNVAAPFLAAFSRPQSWADALDARLMERARDRATGWIQDHAQQAQQASQNAVSANAEVARQAAVAAERSVVGRHTIQGQYVAGVSAQFPETRADWFALLKRYRHNVLVRKDPRG